MRRAVLLCLATLTLVAACGGAPGEQPAANSAGSSDRQAGAPRESVTVAIPGFENNLTPLTISFGAYPLTHDLIHLVYDSLFWSTADKNPEPWLATSAEPSRNATVWTVHLREGVKWHDGEPFTAEDVKFSFDYYNNYESGRYAHHVSEVPSYNHAEIVDRHTVKLFFDHPVSVFKNIPGGDLPILPEHIWAGIEEPSKATEMLPVGTGPFQVTEIVPDQRYTLVANKNYFKGRPLVNDLILTVVKDPTSAFAALRTGQVDLVAGRNVPKELLEGFQSSDDIEILRGTRFESLHLYFNTPKAPLSDPRLRRAIDFAIDDQAIVDTVLQGLGTTGRPSFIHPQSPWALPADDPATNVRYDPSRAKALLDQAGYVDSVGNGIREAPDGTPLDFSIIGSTSDPQDLRAAQLISQQVADIGIKLSVEGLDPATVRQRRQPPESGGPAPFDIRIGSLDTHAHADPDGLLYFLHSGPLGFGEVISGYSNNSFDALAEKAARTGSLEARRQVLYEMQRVIAKEVPVLTLAYLEGVYAFRPEAYDGWFADSGQGIFHKRSFLPK
jgi:peptide/nickel transport system substrate-binding protein